METDNSLTQPNTSQISTQTPAIQAVPAARRGFDLGEMFAALSYPNYRLWFFGQMISLAGTWMQSTAQAYFIYKLTNDSAIYLGYVGAASGIATWLFTLLGGVVSDRMSRRTLLIITQSAMLLLAFVLAALTFTGLVRPWHIILLAFLVGIANAFDAPARLAFVLEMVDRDVLTNAVALNAIMFKSATVVGPAVAGLVYALVGPGWCFVLNGLSFIAVIIALLLMRIKPFAPSAVNGSAVRDVLDGMKYMVKQPLIRILVLGIGLVSLFGLSFSTLVPAWAEQVLHGGPETNGLLQAARGLGALGGGLLIAALGRISFKGKLLTLGSLLFPAALIVFSLISNQITALLMLVLVGGAYVLVANLSNALVQTNADDQFRGRVMSAYSLSFFGLMPIGALLAGSLADRFSPPPVVLGSGAIMLLLSLCAVIFVPAIRKAP